MHVFTSKSTCMCHAGSKHTLLTSTTASSQEQGRATEIEMAPPGVMIMVGVSTGVMRSMIAKLTNLLGDEYNLIKSVKGEIRFLRDELSSMNALLERLADMEEEQIDVQMKERRNKVRELAYDIEDCIDRFMHRLSHGDAELDALRKTAHKMKMLWESHQIANEIKELKTRVIEESHRRNRYNIDQRIFVPQPAAPLDPRAPMLYEEAKNLVGVDGPREEIIKWMKGEEKLLKVVSIFGLGGLGKTTLAMEVYLKIGEPFSCWASISVSRAPDLKKLLKDILFQIDRKGYDYSEKLEEPQLIRTLKECLQDKRYS